MAEHELYGNWLCPPPSPGKGLTRRSGTYSLAGKAEHMSHFRSDSPDSFADEEDYDDVSLTETGNHRPQWVPAEANQGSKAVPGVYVLAGKPAASSPIETADPMPPSAQDRCCKEKSIVVLYILMVVCFAIWAVSLSFALAKYLELSEELRMLNLNHSEKSNAVSNLDDIRLEQQRIWKTINNLYNEFKITTGVLCKGLSKPVKCPSNWKMFEENCYYFSNQSKNWKDAKQFCTDNGSDLVVVNTENEQLFLKMHVNRSSTYWLGLSDTVREGNWVWVDGSPIITSFWLVPRNTDNREEEDCASMQPDGKWNDVSCFLNNYWICEKSQIC
ncbi:C-type lectin domain family 17, member A-like isoform X1 [Alligator sinensis]|uniref:C-type lectin domain family 17, member A-like isoform X1 n=2 Tax=Alligator sinensis TaxID=38654 RepID=A0A1U7RSV6_ALLSI|nr:C-type lectin domain family 17, member A-like isoform X1 [Alligator sinensis]